MRMESTCSAGTGTKQVLRGMVNVSTVRCALCLGGRVGWGMQVKRAHDACGEQRPVSMCVSVCAREAGTERECRLHVSGELLGKTDTQQ